MSRLNVRSLLGQTSSSFSPGLACPRAPGLVLVLLLSPSEPLSGQVLGLGGAAYRLIHKINVGLEARPESLHEHGVARRGQEGLRQAQPGGEGVGGDQRGPPHPSEDSASSHPPPVPQTSTEWMGAPGEEAESPSL